MTRSLLGGMLLTMLGLPVMAQQSGIDARVSQSMDSRFVDATCKLKPNDYRVSSAKTYLKTGIEGSGAAENRMRALNDGVRVSLDAIQNAGQGNNPAAWYYLGRIYLQQGDVAGADSAFSRVERLAPECKEDTQRYRYRAWAALVNGGGPLQQAGSVDSALMLYRAATRIYHDSPAAYYNMAVLYNDQKNLDSAIVNFDHAVTSVGTSADTSHLRMRDQAAFNQAVLLFNTKRYAEAIASFRRYLGYVPNDPTAMKALAGAFRANGQVDSAQVLESRLVAGGAAATDGSESALSSGDYFEVGKKLYDDKKYAEAAQAFAKVLETNPYNRDALNAVANSYLGSSDVPHLVEASARLVAIEPMNENSLKLLGTGYRLQKNTDSTYKVFERVQALPINLDVTGFVVTADGARLTAVATGRAAQTAEGKPITPAPLTLVFEFLDKSGAVVGSSETTVPALKAGATQELKVEGTGSGAAAWRYKKR